MRDPSRRPRQGEEPDLPPNIFVIGLLHDLKAGNYSRKAWGQFWKASWIRSLQIMEEQDGLRHSWLRFAGLGVVGIVLVSLVVLGYRPPAETAWFFFSSLLWWAIVMTDLGLHLGLMVNLESGEMASSLGWPNRMTELRGFASIWVAWSAHWVTDGFVLPLVIVFGASAFTDLFDGWLARRTHASTRWGRLYDPFMDGIFFSVASISLAVIGVLPQWLAALVTLRYLFPVVGGIAFLVVRRRTLRVRHTTWGRLSSASIAVTVFAAAAATVLHIQLGPIATGLYAVVLVAAIGAFITILMKGLEQV